MSGEDLQAQHTQHAQVSRQFILVSHALESGIGAVCLGGHFVLMASKDNTKQCAGKKNKKREK